MAEAGDHLHRAPHLPPRLLPGYPHHYHNHHYHYIIREPHQAFQDRSEAVPCEDQDLTPRLSAGPQVRDRLHSTIPSF